MIRYRVEPDDLHTHHWRVTLTVPQPAADTVVSLPVWIVGSYMVREFGRHLSGLQARQGTRVVDVEPIDKTSWRLRCSGRFACSGRESLIAAPAVVPPLPPWRRRCWDDFSKSTVSKSW